jgi:hypothetical protein
VRVLRQVTQLRASISGHEPQVCPFRALLIRHRARTKVAIRPPGRHHRYFNIVYQAVELSSSLFIEASSELLLFLRW